jgi:hypothetical protein
MFFDKARVHLATADVTALCTSGVMSDAYRTSICPLNPPDGGGITLSDPQARQTTVELSISNCLLEILVISTIIAPESLLRRCFLDLAIAEPAKTDGVLDSSTCPKHHGQTVIATLNGKRKPND